ncbi:DUF6036 family nucleotidyltransferase [Propionicicella superfundia]|uniref:DUF6036 family nucleotidyltransferase n=1 Tax=Propionicicella superfundia TaxID=348582 RepID=UPI000428B160|nr:DUF6036 family nucleotidyltransferase [Propionicicella superfundia]
MTFEIPELDATRLHDLFIELSDELELRAETAQLFVVGGAAMALAYDAARQTRDVDAVFEPTGTIRDLSAVLAQRHGLDDDWINDAAKGFLPGPDEDAQVVFESDTLLVRVASAEYLLAMKLYSGRPGRDLDDAITLYRHAGYTTVDEGIELLEARYPGSRLLARHQYIAAEVATAAASQPGKKSSIAERADRPREKASPVRTAPAPAPGPGDIPPHRSPDHRRPEL